MVEATEWHMLPMGTRLHIQILPMLDTISTLNTISTVCLWA